MEAVGDQLFRIRLDSPATVLGAGVRSTCAGFENGEALCWGDPSWGRLGPDAAPTESVPIPGLDDVEALAAAEGCTCAVRRDRSVWCWGDNRGGGLGEPDVCRWVESPRAFPPGRGPI